MECVAFNRFYTLFKRRCNRFSAWTWNNAGNGFDFCNSISFANIKIGSQYSIERRLSNSRIKEIPLFSYGNIRIFMPWLSVGKTYNQHTIMLVTIQNHITMHFKGQAASAVSRSKVFIFTFLLFSSWLL